MNLTAHILVHLPYLSELQKHGSFTRAAEAMHITQAAMSYQIKQLEDKLSCSLVIRKSGSQLCFTKEGERLIKEYQYCAKRLGIVIGQFGVAAGEGSIRVSAPVDLGSLVMPKLLAQLKRTAPKINIVLHISDDIVDLCSSAWDFAVRSNTEANIGEEPPVYTAPLCVVASSGYLAEYGRPKALSGLHKHSILIREGSKLTSWTELLQGSSVRPEQFEQTISLGTTVAIREAAIEGLGVALLPKFVVADALDLGQLELLFRSSKQATQVQYYLARAPIVQLDYFDGVLRDAFSKLLK